ncbi:MAG TPA: hypothetical protein VE987_15675 [Polyangiaceae bacterium]|nr:hypothetical protein [Polyangiaceae bacterium]
MNPTAERCIQGALRVARELGGAAGAALQELLSVALEAEASSLAATASRAETARAAANARWSKPADAPACETHASASSLSLSDQKILKSRERETPPPIVRDEGMVHRGDPLPLVALDLARKRRPDLTDAEVATSWAKFADRYDGTRGRGRWQRWIDAERPERAPPAAPAPPPSETRIRAAPDLSESERQALDYARQNPGLPPMRLADALHLAQAPPPAARTG